MITIVKNKGHIGHAQGPAGTAAGKDDIFHLGPAQVLDALFTHDPADGIGNIALAAAIWPNNGRDPIFEIDIDLSAKDLKPWASNDFNRT